MPIKGKHCQDKVFRWFVAGRNRLEYELDLVTVVQKLRNQLDHIGEINLDELESDDETCQAINRYVPPSFSLLNNARVVDRLQANDAHLSMFKEESVLSEANELATLRAEMSLMRPKDNLTPARKRGGRNQAAKMYQAYLNELPNQERRFEIEQPHTAPMTR